MDNVLMGVAAYPCVTLMTSVFLEKFEEHMSHLEDVLSRLKKA